MKDDKRIRQTQLIRAGKALGLFVILNFALKLLLLPINEAEYTDGILQLTQFANQTGIYPPLYTFFTWPIAFLIGPLWAGRFVSTVFSALSVIPIYLLARRCYGHRPAVFASLLYTIAPTALRWSPRVMTEATFCFFFWFACERIMAAKGSRNTKDLNSALLWAGILGALSGLTRYQGLFLVIPTLFVAIWQWRQLREFPIKGMLGLLAYLLIPLWGTVTTTIHGGQLAERMGDVALMTFILNAEPFVLYMPYFLTYPVALLVLIGMFKGKSRPRVSLLPLTLFVMSFLLVLQSLFGAFQERYFLPLFGLFFIWGGLGLAVADHTLRRRAPIMRPYVPIVTVTWCVFVAFFVLTGSRQVWGDLRHATEEAARVVKSDKGRLFTNEIYRAERTGLLRPVVLIPGLLTVNLTVPKSDAIVANKVEFFAKMNAIYLGEEYYRGKLPLEVGDILIMSSVYGGQMQLDILRNYYELEILKDFTSTVIPVFPDVMSTPGTDQNPAAWLYRYTPQMFTSQVVRVNRVRRL